MNLKGLELQASDTGQVRMGAINHEGDMEVGNCLQATPVVRRTGSGWRETLGTRLFG